MNNLKRDIRDVCSLDFYGEYPAWVIDTFKRALSTEGEIPAYAEKHINNAIKVANAINLKMEKMLSTPAVTVKVRGHRKNTAKADFDRQLRAAMKGKSGGKTQLCTNPNSRKAQKQARLAKNRK